MAADLEPEFPKPPTPIVNYESGRVREFHVTLLDENDQPVASVPVDLYGMRRGGRWPALDDSVSKDHGPWWRFTTNAQGKILARFSVSEKPWGYTVPRDGRFYFVVDIPDGRRAVSPPIFHGVTRKGAHEEEENEWDAHANDEQLFTDETEEVTMHLVKGRTVTGVVVTPDGKPLQGHTISATHDLHIGSHTGAGGEVFMVTAVSDAEGRFKLQNVYPAACSLSMEGEGYWSRTQVALHASGQTSTRWVGGSITLPELSSDTSMHLRIEVAPEAPKYRYFGTVTDASGKPQAGLVVTAGVSHNSTPKTWSDSHNISSATTDASGRWQIQAEGPWVRFFDVRKTESGDSLVNGEDYESDGVGLAAPGEYHFKIKSANSPTKDR
ncbi:carboxypeptidase family protein [Roseimicrobium gellanilyticum]|uniref:Carboxypeptidase family protein n=1 Tax=Roseimicrobium gellanilyticum TaxID=748857 RepID=A0A366HR81_9BACT|nr:carboxypeptidase-like regulatory domain-containing protein [Roseimicrobium gellanilyticum]RBP45986.1 carboxypeptidase family protein [Roseimicrobium gellanilyticum]